MFLYCCIKYLNSQLICWFFSFWLKNSTFSLMATINPISCLWATGFCLISSPKRKEIQSYETGIFSIIWKRSSEIFRMTRRSSTRAAAPQSNLLRIIHEQSVFESSSTTLALHTTGFRLNYLRLLDVCFGINCAAQVGEGLCCVFARRSQGAKWALHLPTGTHKAAASIRRRGSGAGSHFPPIGGSVPGPGSAGVGGGCFLSRLTGVLVLARRADGRDPRTQVGPECWVWCGHCSCFLLWRVSNIQKKNTAAHLQMFHLWFSWSGISHSSI